MHTHTHIYIYIYIYSHMHAHTHTHTHIYIYIKVYHVNNIVVSYIEAGVPSLYLAQFQCLFSSQTIYMDIFYSRVFEKHFSCC